MTCALVGIGKWGRKLAHKIQAVQPLSCFASTGNAKNIEYFERTFRDCRRVTVEEIATNQQITHVFVAIPVHESFVVAERMLRAGKSVFLEKPGAANFYEMLSLERTARKNDAKLFVDYLYAYDDGFLNTISEKVIESVYFVWRKNGSFGNDICLNLLTHHISMALLIAKHEPLMIEEQMIRDDSARVVCSTKNARFVMDIDRSCNEPVHRVVVKTPETEFEIDLNRERDVDLLEHVVREFLDCKAQNFGLSLDVMRVIEVIKA